MCKEYYEQAYETAIERLCNIYNIQEEEVEILLIQLLFCNPNYLDGYLAYDPE